MQSQAATSIERAIKEHKVTPTARTETNKGKKRPYNNGVILFPFILFHSGF